MKPCENGNDCNCPEVCIVHPMTSPKMSYEEARKESSEKYSEQFYGLPEDHSMSDFSAGSDFGANYERERAAKLVEALNKIKNCEIRYYEQWNGNDKIPDQFEFIDKVLAEYEGVV